MDLRDTRQRRIGRRQSLARDATEAVTGAIITPRTPLPKNTPNTTPVKATSRGGVE
jgi:hypothetical protein